MANKREFKKNVEALGGELCENMMVTWYNVEGADKKAISNAIGKVLGGVEAARSHSNVFFDKGAKAFSNRHEYSKAKKAFFRQLFNKIIADYNQVINDALKEYNGALPQEVKDANKAIAAN